MAHTYQYLLMRVIDDGVAAAIRDYATPEQAAKLEGSLAGFEECRNLSTTELKELLQEADQDYEAAYRMYGHNSAAQEDIDAYWRLRCRALEIYWVCNVLSAALYYSGLPLIVPPTVRGATKAAEILRD